MEITKEGLIALASAMATKPKLKSLSMYKYISSETHDDDEEEVAAAVAKALCAASAKEIM